MKPNTTSAVTRAKGKTAKVPVSKSVNPTTAYKVLFSPKAGISKELSRMTQAAAKEISVAAYAFSSKYLGNALVSAMKRGVKVRLILDKDNAEKAYTIDEWLIENGIDVRFIKLKSGCMHHKFLIVDRTRLMTGSYNFTNDSEFRNHEAAIFIDAAAAATTTAAATLVNAFTAEFDRLWTLAAPPTISGGKG
jgi:phosphatidylserine/phosphatidylglycerophosphate/cardiolipin synthase-like enzyme